MPRQLIALALLLLLLCARAARADEPAPSPAVDRQELGAALGLELGGRTAPGGLLVEGAYLYQITDALWFDGAVAFRYGSGAAECFRDRDDAVLCDHDFVDGFGGSLTGGLRWFLAERNQFTPYLRAGAGLQISAFPADDVRGLVIPLLAGAGLRTLVAKKIALAGGAALRLGGGWFNRDIGGEPHLSLVVQVGVEFGIE